MRSVYLAAAAALGGLVIGNFACGTDNQTSPNNTNIPQSSVCPNPKVHPLAVATEDLAPKELAAMTLALTFDSGPSEATAELEQYLAQQQIHATFFVTGQSVPGLESTLSQTATDGHLVANRGNTFDEDMSKESGDDIVKSITATDTLISALVPAGKLYFRPPFGGWSQAAGTAVAASPMNKYIGPVAWDIGDDLDPTASSDSDCFAPDTGTAKTPQECGDLYLAQIRSKKKGIVLMHDGPPDTTGGQTAAMVQYIVPILKNEGYKFARIDELDLVPESSLIPGDAPGTTTDADGGTIVTPPADDPCKVH